MRSGIGAGRTISLQKYQAKSSPEVKVPTPHHTPTPEVVLRIFAFNYWVRILNMDIKFNSISDVQKNNSHLTAFVLSVHIATSLNTKLNLI